MFNIYIKSFQLCSFPRNSSRISHYQLKYIFFTKYTDDNHKYDLCTNKLDISEFSGNAKLCKLVWDRLAYKYLQWVCKSSCGLEIYIFLFLLLRY